MKTLAIALLHCAPQHKQHAHNLEMVMDLCNQAGKEGAQLVIAPELCLSGYSFNNREDIRPYTDTIDGETVQTLSKLAVRHGFYLCTGIAEREQETDLFYNTALTINPQGNLVGRYRKINAEMRWACPGNPYEDNTFATPWGRFGVLICSDSYHSLMPRITALRGADLLIIPANWPPMGLQPEEIWSARARENGIHVAACNRTGQDLTMDCSQSSSALFHPDGSPLLCCTSQESEIFLLDIPLNADDLLENDHRQAMEKHRRQLAGIHDCSLNLSAIQDLTSFLGLPASGNITITLHVPANNLPSGQWTQHFLSEPWNTNGLHVLPCSSYSSADIEQFARHAASQQVHIVLRSTEPEDTYFLIQPSETTPVMRFQMETGKSKMWFHDLNQARIAIAAPDILQHPEPVLATAKNGCDLIICCEGNISEAHIRTGGVRTIEQTAIAVCSQNLAGFWMPPQGHARWQETICPSGSSTTVAFDTKLTRCKRFQDRVDFPTLLRGIPTLCQTRQDLL